MSHVFQALFTNKIFYASVLSWLAAQLIKTTIDLIPAVYAWGKNKKTSDDLETQDGGFKDVAQSILWRTGGMPSSHSSMSTALVTAIGFQEGITSPIFLVAFFFTTIVVRDAVGVRRIVGILGRQYNLLAQFHNKKHPDEIIEEVKVVEGHSTSEVSVGVLLGVFIGLAVSLF